MTQMAQIKRNERDARSHAIIGAAMEVHGQLGAGFLETIYHEALSIEFGLRNIPYCREQTLRVAYKGHALGVFRADFLCFDLIIVELKAISRLSISDNAQTINYLKATNQNIGILLNFGSPRLEYRRLIQSSPPAPLSAPSASSAESFLASA